MEQFQQLLDLLLNQAGPRGATFAGRVIKQPTSIMDALSRTPTESPDAEGMGGLGALAASGVGGKVAAQMKAARLTGAIADDANYAYHATNLDRAYDIAKSGLKPHKPSFGTDQRFWPDGATENRSYFGKGSNIHQFAPEEGQGVALRVNRGVVPLKQESTGDLYFNRTIKPQHLEILSEDGWKPLTDLIKDAK